jgi:hypothetical protein
MKCYGKGKCFIDEKTNSTIVQRNRGGPAARKTAKRSLCAEPASGNSLGNSSQGSKGQRQALIEMRHTQSRIHPKKTWDFLFLILIASRSLPEIQHSPVKNTSLPP